MACVVGVVGIQGDFDRHCQAVDRAGASSQIVKTPEDLAGVDRLILPGGESTTVGLLMERFGLGQAIIEHVKAGMPVWGTCMGLILLAKRVEDRHQYGLGLLDITVRRNAFGAQVHSFEDDVQFAPLGSPIRGVFIRAPIVAEHGDCVEVLASYDEKIVAVRQGHVVGTSFHPELTDDTRLHAWFLTI